MAAVSGCAGQGDDGLLSSYNTIAMKALILLLLLLWVCAVPAETGATQHDSVGIIHHLVDLAFGEGVRPWAKPLREADMALVRELIDLGVLTRHAAEWAVPAGEDDSV
jgi:hypothetical protein